jgi:hypothetical protein
VTVKFGRGICPEPGCNRVISGRYFGLALNRPQKIILLRHKNLSRTDYCNGGRRVVEMIPETTDG